MAGGPVRRSNWVIICLQYVWSVESLVLGGAKACLFGPLNEGHAGIMDHDLDHAVAERFYLFAHDAEPIRLVGFHNR
jgi:hypothetical protein